MTTPAYLLDTDIVSYSTRGRYRTIAERIAQLEPSDYAISVMTRAELLFGLHQAPATHPSHLRIRRFLGEVQILDWGQDAADTYARLRYQLKAKGTPIDHLDLMIAAHAISLGAILVTNNVRHHGRLAPELAIENWVDGSG
jgi:tRNA(fMet)-specific endonuclease VapC